MFLPLTALIAATNVVAGRVTSREGPRRPLLVGELILIAGLLGMLVFDESTPTAVILVLVIPMGIGGGMVIPPLTAALLEVLPPERAGLASGVFNAARQFGGGLGVAVFGGLVANGFISGMHVALVLGAVAVATTLVLTLAYVPPDPMGEAEPVGA
jgi:DHA2 family methylenomycin A resistance protein-like MFS transporter